MVKTNKGYVRSFFMNKTDLESVQLRCNQRYDSLLSLKHYHQQKINTVDKELKKKRKYLEEQHVTAEKGILGECILQSLRNFDVGTSFMADSLHNVYIGAFVS